MTTHTDPRRTLLAGLLGGIAFVLGTFLTFAQLGGSREGETGLLFDPDTQHEKVITVWKDLEPLPRIVEQPPVVLAGMIGFAVAHAALYRWIAAGWPASTRARAVRLGVVVWTGAVFAEFMGPFNTLHQPLQLSVVAWAMWAVPAFAEAAVVVRVMEGAPVGERRPVRAGG